MIHVLTEESLPVARLRDGTLVQPPLLEKQQLWHIFLSHIWSTGQDQCAVIKRQLQLLLPGIMRVTIDWNLCPCAVLRI